MLSVDELCLLCSLDRAHIPSLHTEYAVSTTFMKWMFDKPDSTYVGYNGNIDIKLTSLLEVFVFVLVAFSMA